MHKFTSFQAIPLMQYVPPAVDAPEIILPEIFVHPLPAYTVSPIDETEVAIEVPQTEEPEEKPKEVSKPITKTSSTALGAVDLARTFLGKSYTYGGKNPNTGFDCSGLIGYVYNQQGIKVPFSTAGLFTTGEKISLKDAKVGDIICSRGSGPSGRHVKIISKIDNDGQIYTIEAKGKKWGIVESKLTNTNNIISVRRVA